MKLLFCFLSFLGFNTALNAADWITLTSPSKAYSVKHPKDWKTDKKDNILSIYPKDETGSVTISAFVGKPPMPNFPSIWLKDTFQNEKPLTKPKEIELNGWKGIRQEFVGNENGTKRLWIAVVAEKENVFVLITANDVSSAMETRKEVYNEIMNSLQLNKGKSEPDASANSALRPE